MRLSPSPTAMISSAGFVGVLALVGALSHSGAGPLPETSALKGEFQSAYEGGFKEANPLKNVAVGAFASLRYGLLSEASPGAVVGRGGWLFTAEELEVHDGFSANIQASAERVAQVRDELAGHGVQLVAAVIPDKAEIYPDQLGLDRPAAVQERLGAFLAYLDLAGVAHIDGAAVLSEGAAAGQMFMRDDTHWTPLGAKAIADAIGLRLGAADIERTGVQTVSLGSTPFDGDLLSFVPTGPFRNLVGPEQRSIERFETTVEASAGLFGDAAIDVALVGTSFSAKPDWHFEGFLKQAISADVLNLSLEGQGPFAPMDAFLSSDVFKTFPPKIVIWEIPARYISKELN